MESSSITKTCDCKGKRTCLLCEKLLDKTPKNYYEEYKSRLFFSYCPTCEKIYKCWESINGCDDHESMTGHNFPGVCIILEFISSEEADSLVKAVDKNLGWDTSQSGRRKKNFGPKVNFKKKKLSIGKFEGFPPCTLFLRQRFKNVDFLKDFITIEECFLEYDTNRGSHIDPHIDDCWIWGERIVTVNCLGNSVLTLTKHIPMYDKQYNIDSMESYESQLIVPLVNEVPDNIVIRIPMPERSLLIMSGPARYQYEHSVLREDIFSRRVAIAYREFTFPYQKGNSKYDEAEKIYKICESK
ncbi:CLUMA_CG020155, isoform A [Clunio marinus]|uniref:CLUMA_CG020155, isoform A n=1 Tax=Clunio marinus TaxID=568069 RepID=A0A1J1J436_9DIPT|nr:CLUMA_CG020155, isoform A [Clunio marinus]